MSTRPPWPAAARAASSGGWISGNLSTGLLDFGGLAAGHSDELGERGREHRVHVSGGRPDYVVLVQPGVDQRADRLRVADRGDAADDLPGGSAHEVGIGA